VQLVLFGKVEVLLYKTTSLKGSQQLSNTGSQTSWHAIPPSALKAEDEQTPSTDALESGKVVLSVGVNGCGVLLLLGKNNLFMRIESPIANARNKRNMRQMHPYFLQFPDDRMLAVEYFACRGVS
jgi:hypothetical protein